MALTKPAPTVIDDWTAIAQGDIVESSEYDCSANYAWLLGIQAFLDSTTVHVGTEFIPQYSASSSGDEDWISLQPFTALNGTAATFIVTTEASSGQKVIISTTLPSGFDPDDKDLLIVGVEDNTLINSELVTVRTYTSNTDINVLDNLANTHAVTTTNCFNIAINRPYLISPEASRVRLVINNAYDSNGSTLNYRLTANPITGL